MSQNRDLQHFYINEEQSFYLLSHKDARKLKGWISLCQSQLEQLGYTDIELIGKGAYGFVFGGIAQANRKKSAKCTSFNSMTINILSLSFLALRLRSIFRIGLKKKAICYRKSTIR